VTTLPLWELPEDTDAGLTAVEAELYRLDPTGDAVASVLRDTLDQLYDGQHSGRWAYEQLHKTEKTHMGTLVEIKVKQLERGGKKLSDEERKELYESVKRTYDEQTDPRYGAARLWIDKIIDPIETRDAITQARAALAQAKGESNG